MKKIYIMFVSICLLVCCFPLQRLLASSEKIELNKDAISGFSDPAHPLSNIVDGDKSTYWQSVSSEGSGADKNEQKETRMYDHNRYITIKLDGVYNVDKILVHNVNGTFNNYYIYASEDGTNYDKIVSKTSDEEATSEGDSFIVSKKAAYIRLNMAYNSTSFETNLAELEIFGSKISDENVTPKAISVTPWKGSTYQKEWDKFETDKSYANSKVIEETQALVARVIGKEWVSKFRFELRESSDGNDVFEIENGNDYIIVRGNDGVSLASGFNYYLKNYAMIDYNPLFESNTEMKGIVKVDKKIVKETQYDVRYALNFCTYSYTMAFWGWDEYEAFIDWAAMNGVNLMLDIVGQEEVIRQTLKQYNYTDEEIKDYIAGPGYFAWFYMQNLYSMGGPLPDNWFEQRVELGRKMHDRMQSFGIDPVIQGFSGQVPLTFDDKNTGAVLTPIDEWPSFTRPAIIKTYLSEEEIAAGKKDYFKDMSKVFYDAQKNIFGDVSNYYAADPFHEGGNTSGLNITDIFKTVQSEMLSSNENAIWVLQQWQGNLGEANLSGLVKPEQALALDLQTDKKPSYGVMEQYNVPWVWSMLHNFGGRMGLDGEIDAIASKPAETKVNANASHMTGLAITPEALENSPIVYELLFDMTWSSDPIDPQKWVNKYAQRRAGGTSDSLQEAWATLHETAYSVKKEYFQGAAETVINARPGMNFSNASTWGHSMIPYDKKELDTALQLLIDNYDEFSKSPAYRYDLADVAEQVLCNAAIEYHKLMVNAYNSGDSAEFKRVSTHYLELIELSDNILKTNKEFMLGTWINDARTMLHDADDWTKDLFEFNARALVTTWGGERSRDLKDYSNRKWAGLTKDFYLKRWSMWVNNRQAELDGTPKDAVAVKAENNWFMWEWQWVNRKTDDGFAYSKTPDYTNLKQLAQKALDDYSTTSIDDFGGAAESDIDIAAGKLFETNPDTSTELRKNLTDGNTATEWKVLDANAYTFTLDLEGTYQINSIEILLQQLAVDFVYNYKVEIFNPNTNAWEVVEANTTNDTMSSQTLISLDKDKNKEASQVRITMNTRDASARPLVVTEFRVKGKALNVPIYYNVAKGIIADSTKPTAADSNITNLTDDNINNLWKTEWGATDSMYPTTVTLDLQNAYDVTSIELYNEKVGLSFKFKVSIIDIDGNEEVVLDKTNITDTLKEKTFKIPVNKTITKVKVDYIGTTGVGEFKGASPAMSELKVLSLTPQKEVEKIINYALKKPVVVSSNDEIKANLNDGNKSTSWYYNGVLETNGTANAEIDLQTTAFIETVNLIFKKEDYKKNYIFTVYGVDESDKEIELYKQTSGDNLESYQIPVNKNIKKVGVHFKGKDTPASSGWYDIVELEALGSESTGSNIVFGEGAIPNVTTEDAFKNTVDNNKDTFVNNIKDTEIAFSLAKNYYVDEAIFTFEKAELGLRYIIYSEDANGNRTLVKDASNSTGILGNKDVSVKVGRTAKKIIFKHLGNNGSGSANLAETRLYEASFTMGKPANALSESAVSIPQAEVLIDGDTTTSYTMGANTSVEFILDKSKDINILHLITEATNKARNSIVNAFKVEAFDTVKNEWVMVYDGSTNTKVRPEYVIAMDNTVFVSKVRLTALSDNFKIAEFKVYEADMTQPLIAYIQEVKAIIASKRYEDNNGSYKPEMKVLLEEKIAQIEAKLQVGMSSKDVSIEMNNLKTALNEFIKNGIIYIDRSTLLSNINYAKVVLQVAKDKVRSTSDRIAKLETELESAKALYTKYDATQTAINERNIALQAALLDVYNDLDVDTRFEAEKLRAEELLKTNIGDKNGQVSQAAMTSLTTALQMAILDYASVDMDKLTVITMLKESIAIFESNIIVVDKSLLLIALNDVNDLQKAMYDIDTWNALQAVIATANTIKDTDVVSQAEIDQAIKSIQDAKTALVLLHKQDLRLLLDQVSALKEKEYTKQSWLHLMEVYEEANDLYGSDEVKQAQIDAMYEKMKAAKDALEKLPEEPSKPEIPQQPNPEIPNGGGNTSTDTGASGNGTISDKTDSTNGVSTGDSTNTSAILVLLIGSGILGGIILNKKKKLHDEKQVD